MAHYPPFTPGVFDGFLTWRTFVSKTASYQILTGDNGCFFDNSGAAGAVTFTLPKIAANYRFGFYVLADQNLIVASSEGGNIVAPNNLAASSVAFQTAGDRIGGMFELITDAAGSLWRVIKPCSQAMTIA